MASYKELITARAQLEKEIEEARKREQEVAVTTIRQLVIELGLSSADIFKTRARKSASTRAAVLPKYRNPETGALWSGRGKTPAWLAPFTKEQRKVFLIGK